MCIDYLRPKTILDYGCGKGTLIECLQKKYPDIKCYGYDPAIPERDSLPDDKIDFLINTDVLEHIPSSELPSVVSQISSITKNCFFHLHHYAATQILPNGENAHCTIKPPSWYHELLGRYFDDISALKSPSELNSVVITFKLPPLLVLKYNQIIKNNVSKDSIDINHFNMLWKIHKSTLKRKMLLYKLLSHILCGKLAKSYKNKYYGLKKVIYK